MIAGSSNRHRRHKRRIGVGLPSMSSGGGAGKKAGGSGLGVGNGFAWRERNTNSGRFETGAVCARMFVGCVFKKRLIENCKDFAGEWRISMCVKSVFTKTLV